MKWYLCTTFSLKCKKHHSKPLSYGIYCTKEAGSSNIATDLYLEGICLNLGWETNYCDRFFIVSTISACKCQVSTFNRPWLFPSIPFPIHYSVIILPFDTVCSENDSTVEWISTWHRLVLKMNRGPDILGSCRYVLV